MSDLESQAGYSKELIQKVGNRTEKSKDPNVTEVQRIVDSVIGA